MTDIFISYSRVDIDVAQQLAQNLQELGYTVWWDMTGLHGGQTFASVIQQKLNEAQCAIVLWSPDSVVSNWVHSEASFADNRGILLTAMYRESQAPMPFNNRHNEDLRNWNGSVFDDGFQKLLKAITQYCPTPSGKPRQAELVAKPDEVETPAVTREPSKPSNTQNVKPSEQSNTQPVKPSQTIKLGSVAGDINSTSKPIGTGDGGSAASGLTKKILATAVAIAIGVTGYFLYTNAQQPAPNSKIYQLDNDLTLVPIPAGSFMMGSNLRSSEKPVHKVTIAKPFWMSKTEITFDQYDAYAVAAGKEKPNDEGWGRVDRPVINVSWNDAQGYVKWLSQNNNQGLQCRLPSEAEWEYAARAGTTTKYFWGDQVGKNNANCKGCDQRWGGEKTAPVASYSANKWGLYDMHGNALEWMQDPWHNDYTGAPNTGEVWEKDGYTSRRVIRGGSWSNAPDYMGSAKRFNVKAPDDRYYNFGFRIVCSSHQTLDS